MGYASSSSQKCNASSVCFTIFTYRPSMMRLQFTITGLILDELGGPGYVAHTLSGSSTPDRVGDTVMVRDSSRSSEKKNVLIGSPWQIQ